MQLHWTLERAARPMDDEGRIYEQVIGKSPDHFVAIYDGATVDADASARSGRTRYRNVPLIAVKCAGEKDFVSRPLTAQDRARFPTATALYEKRRAEWAAVIPLALLPGITPADLAEFAELGITDAATLPGRDDLPPELVTWQVMAKRLAALHKPRLRLVDGKLQEVA